MVWPEYVASKGFNETASALIGELYRCTTGAGHLFIHTDGCCSEFLNWMFCNLFDKLVRWRWFHRITWCVFINSYSLCEAASRARHDNKTVSPGVAKGRHTGGVLKMEMPCPAKTGGMFARRAPGARPARARRATFVLTIPTSAPDLPSHGEAPQVDHVALHTFPTKHVAKYSNICDFNHSKCHLCCT